MISQKQQCLAIIHNRIITHSVRIAIEVSKMFIKGSQVLPRILCANLIESKRTKAYMRIYVNLKEQITSKVLDLFNALLTSPSFLEIWLLPRQTQSKMYNLNMKSITQLLNSLNKSK